jgi:hypothetical protein
MRHDTCGALVHTTVACVALLSGGCGSAPPRPARGSTAQAPTPPATFEDRIRAIVAEVDPDLVYERTELPRDENASYPWLDAAEMLTPMEGAQKRSVRLIRLNPRRAARQ